MICRIVQAQFKEQHFDQDLNFCAVEEDPVTKKVMSPHSKSSEVMFSSLCFCTSFFIFEFPPISPLIPVSVLQMVKRIIRNDYFVKPKDMGSLISSSGTADEDPKLVGHFRDLLEKIFILDPDKRMTVSEALNHPFISGR